MWYRIKQFIWAYTQKLSSEELMWAQKRLNKKQFELFNLLQPSEQRHCVAIGKAIAKHTSELDTTKLIKAALLHDVGKSIDPLSPIQKGLIVLGHKVTGGKLRKVERSKAVTAYYSHPRYSYELLKQNGEEDEELLQWILCHHQHSKSFSEELKLLQYYDEQF